jgi:hypothetical protein
VYIEPRFSGGCEETKNIFFMCETEAYTMFPHRCCSPSFFFLSGGRGWSSFGFIFILQGWQGLPKYEAVNTPFSSFFVFLGFEEGGKVAVVVFAHTCVYICIPQVIKTGSDARWCEGESRKPSIFLLHVACQ